MSYFEDAAALLGSVDEMMPGIKAKYQTCLETEEITPDLQVQIKHVLEDLRSALDYTIHGLYEKYVLQKKAVDIYFPYAKEAEDLVHFRKRVMNLAYLRAVRGTRLDIVETIENMQHWNPDYRWLPSFMKLTNNNKHVMLTPQTRRHVPEQRVSYSAGGPPVTLRWTGESAPPLIIEPGGQLIIDLGEGKTITFDGPQKFDFNHLPPAIPGISRIVTGHWIRLHFSDIDEEVLSVLTVAQTGVQ